MLSKNHPILLFIDRNGFTLFQDTLTDIARFNFTPDLVANLDVVNKEQFSNLITSFIQINKITPSSLSVILSDNIIYIKDLTDTEESKDAIQAFLENVPFEEVLAKVIKTDVINRIVAVNKNLVMTIADAFINKGSSMEAVTPSFMYGQNVNFTVGLTQDNIRTILGNLEILRIGNLLTDQEKIVLPQIVEDEKSFKESGVKKPQGLRQYILIGVLVTLLVIFVVVYLNMGAAKTPPQNKKLKNSASSTVIVPTVPQATIAIVKNDLKMVQIKVVENSQLKTLTDSIKNNLLTAGFKNIISEVSEVSIPEKSSIVFSKDIASSVRNMALSEIKKTLTDITVSESQEVNLTIVIIVGRS